MWIFYTFCSSFPKRLVANPDMVKRFALYVFGGGLVGAMLEEKSRSALSSSYIAGSGQASQG